MRQLLRKTFVIDGDDVRKLISFDLGYTSAEREIQIKRVFGLAKLAIKKLSGSNNINCYNVRRNM